MDQTKQTADEARRVAQHSSMKSLVDRDVNAKIAARTEDSTNADAKEMDEVAGALRVKAIGEVAGRDREVSRARIVARTSQIIDYAFFVLYGLLGIRLVLTLIGARPGAGFVRAVQVVTDPFYSMFNGIVASPSAAGFTLALPLIIALAMYAALHYGISRLLRLIAHRQTAL